MADVVQFPVRDRRPLVAVGVRAIAIPYNRVNHVCGVCGHHEAVLYSPDGNWDTIHRMCLTCEYHVEMVPSG